MEVFIWVRGWRSISPLWCGGHGRTEQFTSRQPRSRAKCGPKDMVSMTYFLRLGWLSTFHHCKIGNAIVFWSHQRSTHSLSQSSPDLTLWKCHHRHTKSWALLISKAFSSSGQADNSNCHNAFLRMFAWVQSLWLFLPSLRPQPQQQSLKASVELFFLMQQEPVALHLW
jgi:hypothetical protein